MLGVAADFTLGRSTVVGMWISPAILRRIVCTQKSVERLDEY